jgi:hypothetical protein
MEVLYLYSVLHAMGTDVGRPRNLGDASRLAGAVLPHQPRVSPRLPRPVDERP